MIRKPPQRHDGEPEYAADDIERGNAPGKPYTGPRKRFGDQDYAERRERWSDDEDRR